MIKSRFSNFQGIKSQILETPGETKTEKWGARDIESGNLLLLLAFVLFYHEQMGKFQSKYILLLYLGIVIYKTLQVHTKRPETEVKSQKVVDSLSIASIFEILHSQRCKCDH